MQRQALIKIANLQETNAQHLKYAHNSLEIASKSVGRSSSSQPAEQEFKKINEYTFEWLTHFHATYNTRDFTSAFESFIGR